MSKKTVTKETTEFAPEEIPMETGGGNGNGRSPVDEADPVVMERSEALRTKYQYAAKRNKMALEELDKKMATASANGDVDEMDKLQMQLMKTMKNQVTMKQLTKMLDDGESSGRKNSEIASLTSELKEAFQYLDKRLDAVTNDKSNDRFMAMMQQQAADARQAQAAQMQMMMALLTRQDPNAAMTQQILLKTMDQKASIKDFLPMMAQFQTMGMQQSADLEKSRMGIMQEIVLHALSAGDKDWETMSIPEKAEFIMGMMRKGGAFVADKINEVRARKYERDNKPKQVEGKPQEKLGLAQPPATAVNPAANQNPEAPAQAPGTSPAPGATPSSEDAELKAIIADRVNRILKVIEIEMRLGSDPAVVFEEIEKLYFGLPQDMRNMIESDENPMKLVQAIEPYADKAMMDKITKMALEDQAKADWLKDFHQAVLGIEPEDEEEEEEEDADPQDPPTEQQPPGTSPSGT